MAGKLVIIMANSGPGTGIELGPPLYQAATAAAMDYEVEVICTAGASRLMKKGVAETLTLSDASERTVYEFIKDARAAGVVFYCCVPNLHAFDMTEADLIPECAGLMGGARLIEELMESDCRVLSY